MICSDSVGICLLKAEERKEEAKPAGPFGSSLSAFACLKYAVCLLDAIDGEPNADSLPSTSATGKSRSQLDSLPLPAEGAMHVLFSCFQHIPLSRSAQWRLPRVLRMERNASGLSSLKTLLAP